MILIESQGPVPPIYIKYMNEEGIKVSARPLLVLTCLKTEDVKFWLFETAWKFLNTLFVIFLLKSKTFVKYLRVSQALRSAKHAFANVWLSRFSLMAMSFLCIRAQNLHTYQFIVCYGNLLFCVCLLYV